jgi:hypothetical protein
MAKTNKDAAASVPEAAIEEVPEVLPKGIIRVRAVIRPMYAPFSGVMIPDDGPGVLIESGSWTDAQLERGLIREC